MWRDDGIARAGRSESRLASTPRSWWLFALLVTGMGVEQGYEALGLYLPRYLHDQKQNTQYCGFGEGLRRLASCAEVTQSMDVWQNDAAWMTAYFSIGVWSSIWLSVARF